MPYLWKKNLKKSLVMIKIIEKLKAIVILQVNIGAAHSIRDLKFNVPKEILVVFHDCSKYDHHFIIKELVNKCKGKLKGQFE